MNFMKKADKFEWSKDMEQDFKELKAEFTLEKYKHIQILNLMNSLFLLQIGQLWILLEYLHRSKME